MIFYTHEVIHFEKVKMLSFIQVFDYQLFDWFLVDWYNNRLNLIEQK